jgi:DNA polymerase-3 subunit epsilon
MKIMFFDLETTGVDPKLCAIHQLSGIIEIDGEIKETFNFKLKPFNGALIEKSALEIAGVTEEQIHNYPSYVDVQNQFLNLMRKYVSAYDKLDKFFLCGFNNASFDNHFLRAWFSLCGDKYYGSWFWPNTLDVMVLATQKLLEMRYSMPNFQLKTVAASLKVQVDQQKLHDAVYDVELTRQIYHLVTFQNSK